MWWLFNRSRIGTMIRAGVDDRDMLAASGVRVRLVFAFGAGLAGLNGVVGGTFQSLAPGEDTGFLLPPNSACAPANGIWPSSRDPRSRSAEWHTSWAMAYRGGNPKENFATFRASGLRLPFPSDNASFPSLAGSLTGPRDLTNMH